jgi:hypothetical protein
MDQEHAQTSLVTRSETQAKDLLRRDGWLRKTPESFQINLLGRCCFLWIGEGEHVYGLDDPPGGIQGVASGSLAISMAPQEDGPCFAQLMGIRIWFGFADAMNR